MEITIIRKYLKYNYTIGDMLIDGVFFCNTLEDTDRNLYQDMDVEYIKSRKIIGNTAIPYGTYKINTNISSSKYSNYIKYPWAKKIKGKVPRVMDVKGFDGILIHVGNTDRDTLGCILVGENKIKGKVINSTDTFNKFIRKLPSDEEIILKIIKG